MKKQLAAGVPAAFTAALNISSRGLFLGAPMREDRIRFLSGKYLARCSFFACLGHQISLLFEQMTSGTRRRRSSSRIGRMPATGIT